MGFVDSVVFASLMTLIETIKEEEENRKAPVSYDNPKPKIELFNPDTDVTQGAERLTHIVQTIFDEGSKIDGTEPEGSASDYTATLLCGLFYEALKASSASPDEACAVYDFAVKFSNIDTPFIGEFLFFEGHEELADGLTQATDIIVNMVMTVGLMVNPQIPTEFNSALAEFLCGVEEAVKINFPSVAFQERLPIISLGKFMNCAEMRIKTMEEENPDIQNDPEVIISRQESERLNKIRHKAREALACECFAIAQGYYEELLFDAPDDWEAIFYSVYCDCAADREYFFPQEISSNCARMGEHACKAVKIAGQNLFSRCNIINCVADITVKTCSIASSYFVATIEDFNQTGGNSVKIRRVNAIIKMLFDVGDAIEQSFGNDMAICMATAYECWNIAFCCYEHCDIPAPPEIYEHYQKILKYNPSYHCSKPVVGSDDSSGCYIATCVYGSYNCPEVWTLRRYRDYTLAETWYGRAFIRAYYAVSPKLVNWFGHTKWFKRIWRNALNQMVKRLQAKGIRSTPYKDRVW